MCFQHSSLVSDDSLWTDGDSQEQRESERLSYESQHRYDSQLVIPSHLFMNRVSGHL